MPESADRTKFRELIAFWATVVVVRTLNGNKAVGQYLLDQFEKERCLIKYYEAAYDRTREYGITSRDVMDNAPTPTKLNDVPKAFGQTLRGMETNPSNRSGSIEAWLRFLGGLPPELREVANAVLDHDLDIPGLPLGLLNVVLRRVGRSDIPDVSAKRGERGLAIMRRANDITTIYFDGQRAGTLDSNVAGQNALRTLVAMGVVHLE